MKSFPLVKHGGGSIVPQMFLSNRDLSGWEPSRLVRIDSELNRSKYRNSLEENLLQRAPDLKSGCPV